LSVSRGRRQLKGRCAAAYPPVVSGIRLLAHCRMGSVVTVLLPRSGGLDAMPPPKWRRRLFRQLSLVRKRVRRESKLEPEDL